jgi:hypothetical protein
MYYIKCYFTEQVRLPSRSDLLRRGSSRVAGTRPCSRSMRWWNQPTIGKNEKYLKKFN